MSKDKKELSTLSLTFKQIAGPVNEYWTFRQNVEKLNSLLPDGNDEPVLFLPGFIQSDRSLTFLRKSVREKGYFTYGWANGINTGPTEDNIQKIKDRLKYIHDKHGTKVALVGHSLGGVLARELSRDYPHMVSQVITLGSPFGMSAEWNKINPIIKNLFQIVHSNNPLVSDEQLMKQLLSPPPVPTTSIYTRHDLIVDWKTSINPQDKRTENIEVDTTHTGMCANQSCYVVILDRLSLSEKNWKPFDKKKYPEELFYEKEIGENYNPAVCPSVKNKPHKSIFKKKSP
jgi:esterase/lipase